MQNESGARLRSDHPLGAPEARAANLRWPCTRYGHFLQSASPLDPAGAAPCPGVLEMRAAGPELGVRPGPLGPSGCAAVLLPPSCGRCEATSGRPAGLLPRPVTSPHSRPGSSRLQPQ